ncbi:chromosome partition protein MukE [Proteus hauseri]|uniref:chromosome partition protein MukE n=1 Tax=Proteus hauseri TaxID=183417 RepID=UPI0032D9C382
MSSIHTEQFMPAKLAQALANSLFPELDSQLRAGRHIGIDSLDDHAFLMDFQDELSDFYARYNVELIRAPEGFFYLRPRSTTLIPRSVLSEMDMLVGKILCYLYLSPERLANQGIFTVQELFDELRTLADESKLLRLVNQRSTGSDLDLQKLQEKMRTSLNRLRRLGMIAFLQNDLQRFSITESVFRFGADVRSGDSPIEAQMRMIRDGEAMALESEPELSNDDDENEDEDEQLHSSEDDAEEENK